MAIRWQEVDSQVPVDSQFKDAEGRIGCLTVEDAQITVRGGRLG